MTTNSKSSASPLVSAVVPTRNSAGTLRACLKSIEDQTYPNIEVIVVDRNSTDGTQEIASSFTSHVHQHGPERSAQRNLGAKKARGEYLLFVDSDMELSSGVIDACVQESKKQPILVAVTIPEISFGQGFWAKCKALERSYYSGVDWVESPRFISTASFSQVKGYDEDMAGGEDWDLTRRLKELGPVGRITPLIRHNEGHPTLRTLVGKRLYYAGGFASYYAKSKANNTVDGMRMIGLFLSRPTIALRHPIRWCGMLIMRASELTASAVGFYQKTKNDHIRSVVEKSVIEPTAASPLVSVIVPTRNNADTLSACLQSIKDQTYTNIELIVVDRDSIDETKAIAKQFTPHVFNHRPERSAQRNFGASKARGEYLLFVDSDMDLEAPVIEDCVELNRSNPGLAGINIPEISFGQGFWAKCKAFERSYYVGVSWVECPRFVSTAMFNAAGRYNERVAGGEDWDLAQRLRRLGSIANSTAIILHNEGRIHLSSLMKKRVYYYGEGWHRTGQPNHFADGPRLLVLYLSRPSAILRHPVLWSGMMTMRTLEFLARLRGYSNSKLSKQRAKV